MMKLIYWFSIFLCLSTKSFAQSYQYPGSGDQHWQAPVAGVGSLPSSGNQVGDLRIETTTFGLYAWDGAMWLLQSTAGAAPGTVTNVTGTSPIVITGVSSVTPNVTCNVASGAQAGCLAPADWTTFNNKQSAISTSSAPAHQFGTGFTAPNTFTYAQPSYSDVSGNLPVSVTAPITTTGGASPTLAMAASTNAVDGYMTAADHTTFSGKQDALSTSAAVVHQFLTAFTAPNTFSRAQPACSDLSDGVASCSTDTTNAANISSGLLALARGGNHADLSATGGAHQVLRQSGAGADVTVGQLACSDLSNGVASCSTDTTNAANISSGLLALARGGTHADLSATGGVHQFLKQSGAGSDITVGQPDFTDLSGQLGTAQLPTSFDEVFIDYVSGNDANNGSVMAPWKTFAHTCATITPTINVPVVIHVTGGNNDTDAAPISCPPNIAVTADYGIQISQPFTITGGATNDSVAFRNFIFIGALTWIRNDATTIAMSLDNSEFFSGPVFKQNGAGTASVVSHDSVFVNGDFVLPGTGSFFYNPTFLGATTKFGDATNAAYYQVMGGYNSSDMQVSGGAQLYLSGLQCDFPFGCALDGTTTAKGTPLFQSDDGSVPASIGGAFTFNPTSHAQHVEYTPTTAGDWSSVPATVLAALDNLASTGVYKSQAANKFFASPNGAPGPMSPRSIVAADVPTLNQNTTGTAANLSGTPALPNGTTATTQAPGDNSTKLATTAYADAAAAGGGISSLNTDVVAAGPGAAVATIQPGVVTNAKMANMAANTIKGNNTGGALAPIDLSIAQVNTMLGTVTSLTGEATGSGPGATAVTLSNAAVIGKVLTGFVSGAGVVAATDTILQAFNKLVGNVATKGCKWNIVTKTANYTAVACDVILADATGGAFTITIPLAGSATTADEIKVKKIDSSANAVAVTASGADNVEYLATQSLSTQGDAVDLHPDGGTNWYAF